MDFNQANKYTVPVLVRAGNAAISYGVRSFPETVFIDSEGVIRAIQYGVLADMSELEAGMAKIASD